MISQAHHRGTAGNGLSPMLQNLIYYVPLGLAAVGFLCCLVIELCGIAISNENRNLVYDITCIVATVFGILLNTVYGRFYALAWRKSFVSSFFSYLLVFICLSEGWTRLDTLIFGVGSTAAFRSIMFMPLLCMILSRFCEQDTWNLCDYFTPYFFFTLGFTALTCWIVGCCAGRPWSWGLINPLSGVTVFPTQPCIIILSIAVAYWGLYFSKKHAYKANGMVFANSLIAYGFFRYLIELYTDKARVCWVLSWFSICALAMLAQGLLVRYFAAKRDQTP